MPATRPLWADPAAREPQRGWFERSPVPPGPEPDGGDEPPQRRSPARIALVAVLAFLALAAAAALGAVLARGNDEQPAKSGDAADGALAAGRVSALFTAAAPGVVRVRTGDRSGTGFVLRDGGTIVTTAHAVGGGGDPRVVFGDPDRPVPATLVGTDEASGLAVVTVDPAAAPRLRALPLGDSDAARVGDPVLAISYPAGLDRNVTTGIVSGVGSRAAHAGGLDIDKALQTDARADAGAPLLGAQGQVIGLLARTPRTGTVSVAIPASTINEVVPQIEAGFGTTSGTGTGSAGSGSGTGSGAGSGSGSGSGTTTTTAARAYLGVQAVDAASGSGALIEDAVAGGPADTAGLQGTSSTGPGGGDTILAIETTRITSAADLTAAVAEHEPGDVVTLLILRAGQKFNLDVTLGERP